MARAIKSDGIFQATIMFLIEELPRTFHEFELAISRPNTPGRLKGETTMRSCNVETANAALDAYLEHTARFTSDGKEKRKPEVVYYLEDILKGLKKKGGQEVGNSPSRYFE